MTDTKLLLRIVSWRDQNKPVAWIARREELDVKDVRAVLRVAGDRTSHYAREIALDKYDQVEYLVNQHASLTDIMRTTGCDNRTIRRWFPHAGWGAGSESRKNALSMSSKFQEIAAKTYI